MSDPERATEIEPHCRLWVPDEAAPVARNLS